MKHAYASQLKKLGKKIKKSRLSKKLTQQKLADLCEVDIRTIQRIEKGELVPRSHTLKTLAEILELSFEDFMKAAREQEFSIPQADSYTLTRPQRTVLSVGICVIILLLALAYVAQAPKFPETTFELLIFLSSALALITMVLFMLWRKRV